MLTLLPQPHRDRLSEARAVIEVVELGRHELLVAFELVVLPLLAVCLLAAGCEWAGWLMVGAAIQFAVSRYGPHWWPGRR